MQSQKTLTLSRLIMIARNRDVQGLINKKTKFKFENKEMYIMNHDTGLWEKPNISCSWFDYKYQEVKNEQF